MPATAAGCDMFLFFRNPDEDFRSRPGGRPVGVITEERLHEALTRILGLKATLGLHTMPREGLAPVEALAVVGSAHPHHAVAADVADKTVTGQGHPAQPAVAPRDPHRRIRLYGITWTIVDFTGTDPYRIRIAQEELESEPASRLYPFKECEAASIVERG